MKATLWIGCILLILLGCTSLCMANETIGNETEVIVENISETITNDTNVTEIVDEAVIIPAQVVNESEQITSEVAQVQEVTPEITAEETPNTTVESETQVPVVSFIEQKKNELAAFVADTRMVALKAGKDAAISAFNDRAGQYANPDMPVFAYDITGKVLANSMDPNSVGTNQISVSSPEGIRYVQMMIDTAKNGGGFVEYTASNILDQGKLMKKMVYVSSVDGSWFIGSGIFLEDEAERESPSAEDLVSQETAENSTASA